MPANQTRPRIEHTLSGASLMPVGGGVMVDQVQVIANLDAVLDACRRFLASDTHDLALVRRTYERIDELLEARMLLTRDTAHASLST